MPVIPQVPSHLPGSTEERRLQELLADLPNIRTKISVGLNGLPARATRAACSAERKTSAHISANNCRSKSESLRGGPDVLNTSDKNGVLHSVKPSGFVAQAHPCRSISPQPLTCATRLVQPPAPLRKWHTPRRHKTTTTSSNMHPRQRYCQQ